MDPLVRNAAGEESLCGQDGCSGLAMSIRKP